MNIPRLILKKLREEHQGHHRAIKRKDLLIWLYNQSEHMFQMVNFSDRNMRTMIEKMPVICSCESGYYIARDGEEGEEDVAYTIKYINKKAMPLLKKIRDKKRAYPQYYSNKYQGDLPYEDET